MSISAVFYTLSKKLNSTKQPTGTGQTYNIILKDNCSVLAPDIKLDVGIASNPCAYNYCYIADFNRYYYVSWEWSERLWIGHCKVDPLASWKTTIGASSQYVVRSASSYNLKVMDSRYPTIADTDETVTPLSSISSNIDISNGTIVLGLKSKTSDQGVGFYVMNSQEFSDFVDYLYSDIWMDATDISTDLQKILIDPFDFIVSCNWYPFSITGTGNSVYFGFWDWTGHTMHKILPANRIKSFLHSGTLPDHPQISRGSYLNASPYRRLEVDLYSFGKFVIDPNRFLDSNSFSVNLKIDLYTGIGTVSVESTTGNVYEASATCAIPIQLSQVKNDLTRPIISAAVAGASLAAENYVGAAGSIADAVKSALPQISTIGAVGSISAYAYNVPKVSSVFYRIANEDLAQIGRPLCATTTISSLSGYIECDNADLDIAATPQEINEIISAMNEGFYYE